MKIGKSLTTMGISARRWLSTFVKPSNEIRQEDLWTYGAQATTVAALYTSGKRIARTRQVIYNKWAEMEGDPVISSALRLHCTAALGGHETTGQVVFLEKTPEAQKDTRKGQIVEEIDRDLSGLLNRVAFTLAYTACTFGDAYARIYATNAGVIDLYTDELVRPPLIQPYERGSRTVGYAVYMGEKLFERLDLTQLARVKMPRTQWVPQYGVYEKAMKIAIQEDNLEELPVMPSMVGGSLLYNAELAYDNLAAALLGLVGQRVLDSIDEQILTVNMENMTKDQRKIFADSIIKMLKTSKERADAAVTAGKPILERIRHLIPTFNEKQVLNLQGGLGGSGGSSGGRTSNITIEDVLFHAKMLAGALGIDLSMLGFADILSGGLGEGGFFRMSAQAAEYSRWIRGALTDGFNNIIDIHTLRRYGMVFDEHERPWQINFYGSISALEKERASTRLDSANTAMLILQAMASLKELGADKKIGQEFLSKELKFDEDEAKLYAKLMEMQSEPLPGEEGGFGQGGGFGGGEEGPPKVVPMRAAGAA